MNHLFPFNIRQFLRAFAALVLSATFVPSIHAASQTWDGGSLVDGNWATTTNWVGDPTAPGNTSAGVTTNTDTATFNTIANGWGNVGTPILIDSGRTVNGINFDPGLTSDLYFGTTGGNALYYNGQIKLTTAATYNLIIDAPLVTIGAAGGSNDKIRNNSTKNLTVNGTISGLNAAATGVWISADTTTGLTTINGVISNGGATTYGVLGNASAGTVILNGANTYTGATSITGTFSVASLNSVSGGAVSSNLGAPVTVTDGTIAMGATTSTGTLKYTGTGETTDRVIDLAGTTGGAKIDQSGTGLLKFTSNLTASIAGAKTLTLLGSTAGTGQIAGAIVDSSGGATALTKTGTGTWTLSGLNTYTGATTVTGGTLSINTLANTGFASAVGSNGTIILNAPAGGSLTYTGGAVSTDRAFDMGTSGGSIFNSGSGLLTLTGGISGTTGQLSFRGSKDVTVTGLIATGSGVVASSDSHTLTLSNAANSFTGLVLVANGVISANSIADSGIASALGAGTTLKFGGNFSGASGTGKLLFTGASGGSSNRSLLIANGVNGGAGVIENSVAGQTLTLSGAVSASTPGSASALTLQGVGNGVLSGNITGSPVMSVTKSGAGTWTLSGANTYSGGTTVSGGTLLVNNTTGSGTGSGNVSINGGTLGGNGTISGAVTLTSGSLNPGNSTGLLTVGSLILNAGTTNMEINDTGRGTTYDAIDITSGGAIQLGGTLAFNFGNGADFTNATTFNLFAFNTTSSGNFSGITSAGYAAYSGLTWTQSGDVWSATAGNGQMLNFSELTGDLSVIPEPSTWVLVALGLTVVTMLRRRVPTSVI